MNSALVDKLIEVRKSMLRYDSAEKVYKYHLADFSSTEGVRYAIPDSPFRAFPSVPQDYSSKRKQNNTIAFDPYRDTLFDYPLVVKHLLQSPLQAVEQFNYRETYFTELVCLGFSSLRYHIKLVLRELVIVRKSLQMNKNGIFGGHRGQVTAHLFHIDFACHKYV